MPLSHTEPAGFQREFVAELFTARRTQLASHAAVALCTSYPAVAARYRPIPEQKWAEHFSGRISDLIGAIVANSPTVFAEQIAWARSAAEARRVPVEDIALAVKILRNVLLHEVPPEDAEVLAGCFDAADRILAAPVHTPPTHLTVTSSQGRLGAAYLLALLQGDRAAASRQIVDAARAGLTIRQIYLDVLVPVLREMGRMWHLGEVSVAEEHFATATTQMVMAQLMVTTPRAPASGRAVLAASVDGNNHDLGVRMVSDFFELAGWRAVYLGPSMPIDELVTAALDFDVDLIALSAALPSHFRTLADTIHAIRAGIPDRTPAIIVGGYAFGQGSDLWKALGADGCATDPDHAVTLADTLVPVPRSRP